MITQQRSRNLFIALIIVLLSWQPNCVMADYAVIVHPSNHTQLDLTDIRRIFLLKIKQFPDGKQVAPIDRREGSTIRREFIKTVIGTDEIKLKAYWARLLFTGKVILPRTLNNDAEVTSTVAENPASIGYVDSKSVTDDVRVVETF